MACERGRVWRLVLLPVLVLAAATGVAPAPARAAPAAAADQPSIPVLLLHDTDDDCRSSRPATAAGILRAAGFATLDLVGYHSPGDAAPGLCSENLQRLPPLPGLGRFPGVDSCDALEPDARVHGTGNDHLDRLSCLLAWYVYERYTQFGKPVNVLASGMGGLLVRDAIGASDAAARDFPPRPLWVANVVTVATPHGGIDVPATGDAELDDMRTGSAFMAAIAGFQRPQGYGGTHWALVGSSEQVPLRSGFASASSQVAMAADYEIVYPAGGADLLAAAGPAIAAQLGAVVPPALPGEELTLRSAANDRYVTAELGYPTGIPEYGLVRARAAVQGPWERWTAVQLPSGHWAIRNDVSGEYIAAELGRAGDDYNELRARTDFADLGPWEVWDLVPNPNGTFSLQLADLGRDYYYVTAELFMSGPRYGLLRARNSSIGTWEQLTSGGPPPGPELLGTPDFDGYCRMDRRGKATVVAGNPYSWACSAPGTAPDPQAVCAWTYWTQAVDSRLGHLHDPYSWQCWG